MTWNYRIVNKNGMLGIYEAFYNGTKIGAVGAVVVGSRPHSITENPIDITGSNPDELADMYKMMAEAFEQPILEYDEIGDKGKAKRRF